ncbi:MAG: DUF4261 domain-containing protein [Lachnospiraceae bacterium]|nr:DUF4261 domain-containing protein [Lachnospiraceae bacterium]
MSENSAKILAGCVLLSDYKYDWDVFRMQLFDDWKMEVTEEAEEFSFQFTVNDVHIACMLVPAPKQGAAECGANNYEWPEAAEKAAAHVAHVEIGVMDCENPLQRHVLFTMLASSMMKQENVIGLYQYPVVHRAQTYIEGAQVLLQDEFPVTYWVYIGLYRDKEGDWNSYTYGMEDFDKEEIEILHSKAGLIELYRFMTQIVTYLITSNDTLEPGQRIGSDEKNSYEITRSKAAAFDGETLKIAF